MTNYLQSTIFEIVLVLMKVSRGFKKAIYAKKNRSFPRVPKELRVSCFPPNLCFHHLKKQNDSKTIVTQHKLNEEMLHIPIIEFICVRIVTLILIYMLQSTKIGDFVYLQKHLIGSGAYSRVYLAESPNGKKAAVKKVKKTNKDLTSYKLAKSQAKILNGLRSPLVCQLLGTYQEENHYYLIQKYYEGKTLAHLLQEKKRISFYESLNIFKGIIKSLEYLITHDIMHRDLKPENIIFHHNRVIIIDFGFACKINKKDEMALNQKVGTPIYMSPELLKGEKYNSKSDIWSLGVILYEMIHGFPPFKGSKEDQILQSILNAKKPEFKQIMMTQQLKELIFNCLKIDVDKRAKWQQLFQWRKIAKFGDIKFENSEKSTFCCLFQ